MTTFNLKKKWFSLISSGEKNIEYREVKPYWSSRMGKLLFRNPSYHFSQNEKIENLNIPCKFVMGYTKKFLYARITKVEIINGENTDLKYNGLVFAIHFKKEEEYLQ